MDISTAFARFLGSDPLATILYGLLFVIVLAFLSLSLKVGGDGAPPSTTFEVVLTQNRAIANRGSLKIGLAALWVVLSIILLYRLGLL
jgi:hypothetical protein